MKSLQILDETQKIKLQSPEFRQDSALSFQYLDKDQLKERLLLVNNALGQAAVDGDMKLFGKYADYSDQLADGLYGRVFHD